MTNTAAPRVFITVAIVLMANIAIADELERGFFDICGGPVLSNPMLEVRRCNDHGWPKGRRLDHGHPGGIELFRRAC